VPAADLDVGKAAPTVIKQSSAARDGLFGIIEVAFLVALVRGGLGASTTAGRIVAIAFMGACAVGWGLLWRVQRRHRSRLDIGHETIVKTDHANPDHPLVIDRSAGDELYFTWGGNARYRFPILVSGSTGVKLALPYYSKKPVQAACIAHGWRFMAEVEEQQRQRRKRFVRRQLKFAGVLSLIVVLLVSLAVFLNSRSSSKSPSASAGISVSIPPLTPTTTPAPPTTMPTGHVGSTLTVSMQGPGLTTSDARVTLVKMIDPASGSDEFTTPDAGTRFVAAEFQIVAVGAVSDDASLDAAIVGSDKRTYQADAFDTIAGCTDFNAGEVTLRAGASSTGCVTFEVRTGVTPAAVTFGTQFATIGQWQVP
jgi:hypothetical protein